MFNEFQRSIFCSVLEQASDEMSNNGCNDFPIEVTEQNKDQVIEFVKSLESQYDEEYISSLQEDAVVGETIYFQDYALLTLLGKLI